MSDVHELLRANFEQWEARGRGALTFDFPVHPRPPFAPFPGHVVRQPERQDDGVRHSGLSSLLGRCAALVRGEDAMASPEAEAAEDSGEIEPEWLEGDPEWTELQMRVPLAEGASREAMGPFLASLSRASQPLAFEIIGARGESWVQWAAAEEDADHVKAQIQAHFPEVKVTRAREALLDAWDPEDAGGAAVMEFALAEYFMWPLAIPKADPFVTLLGAMDGFGGDEVGVYQVIFTPLFEPWAGEAQAAVSRRDGRPFFGDDASLQKAAGEKLRQPLYGAVVRLAARADDPRRAWEMVGSMVSALAHFSKPGGNEFRPLPNEDYDIVEHVEDFLNRRSRRPGMILGQDELTGLVHLPSPAVRSKRLLRSSEGTQPAPSLVRADHGVCIGLNAHDGESVPVWLSVEERVRHVHVLGASGSGKSNLLLQMIRQDMENGEGFGVLDPHGDVIDAILERVPEHRLGDVVLIDPADEEYSVGFNVLSAHSEAEKTLLASDLVSVFQRLSTSWGDQMGSVFGNAIRAFLESREGGTLVDLRRFLLDKAFRQRFLKKVDDPDLVFYWEQAFPQLGSNKSIGPILTRLETFLAPKPIRRMVAQKTNRLDFAELTDSGRIVLARLSQGQIGRENAYLLGSLLVTKFQQAAMARQRMEAKDRRFFSLYIDEFQNFITPSMAEILSGVRKYRLGMVLAHQDLNQLRREPDVANAVLANACVRLAFRVSEADAKALESGFSHFAARDMQNLEVGHAIGRIGRSDADFNLQVSMLPELDRETAADMRRRAIAASRERYASSKADLDAAIGREDAPEVSAPAPSKSEAKQSSPSESVLAELEALRKEIREMKEGKVSTEDGVLQLDLSASPAPQKTPPPVPAELGRGGEVHHTILEEIKTIAEPLGFRATIERQLPGTLECTDLLLEREGLFVAVEVSVTNTIDYELKNIGKCLRAGVACVVAVAPDEAKLAKLKAAALVLYGDQHGEQMHFLAPGACRPFLESLPKIMPSKPRPAEIVHKGWKVKTKRVELSSEELQKCETSVASILAEASRKLRP